MSDEKDDKWEMPKPVFRSSTGSLPRRLEETISHSFMPNAETIEIDEDDDILSIMDTPYKSQPVNLSEGMDHEKTIEIERDIAMETEADHKPIVVTAKEPDEKIGTTSRNSTLNIFLFVLIALMVVAITVVMIYYQPN